tara:strand:+ start:274 stop:729 length:456 start_codon:yes stop_codon:yes gene_type:complete
VLIKTLVAITSLGVLAVAAIAAFNPQETSRKDLDTVRENYSKSFVGASVEYYKASGEYPWNTSAKPIATQLSSMGEVIGILENEKFLGAGYINHPDLDKIFVTAEEKAVYACFLPSSKSLRLHAEDDGFRKDASRYCLEDDCYRCVSSNIE